MSRTNPRHGLARTVALGAAASALVAAASVPAQAENGPTTSQELRRTQQAVIDAGMYGINTDVQAGYDSWRRAAGVANIDTRAPMRTNMEHRVGSITKSFVAVTVLRLAERGAVELDAPAARYLPELITEERDKAVSVRMLLNHTSNIADYVPYAWPSFIATPPTLDSLFDNQFTKAVPETLARLGLDAPPTGEPGVAGKYSNTNYILLGLLIERVTGEDAEDVIDREAIRPAGLKHTYLPRSARIRGPHPSMYDRFHGAFDPPQDFRKYDASWFWTAGALISTPADLTRFYERLLGGALLTAESLAEMQTRVDLYDPTGTVVAGSYGLGLQHVNLGCGPAWGHTGSVWGALTYAFAVPGKRRQVAVTLNLNRYNDVDADGNRLPHPIDPALVDHLAMGGCEALFPWPDPAARAPAATVPALPPLLPPLL